MSEQSDQVPAQDTPPVQGEAEQVPAEAAVPVQQETKYVSRRGRKLFAAILVILFLALIGVSVLLMSLVLPKGKVAKGKDAGGLVWVRSIYGWGSTPKTQLQVPKNVYIDNAGTIWVSDGVMKVVTGFNPSGKRISTMVKNPETKVVGLGAMTFGPEGALFVNENEMDRVRVFSSNDADLGYFPIPAPIDLDYRDNQMVIGARSGFAVVDPQTGKPKKLVGTRGSGPGQFDGVSGIILHDGIIYLVDTYNNRLESYTLAGKQLWSVRTGAPANKSDVAGGSQMKASLETSAPAKLSLPLDVCVDGRGRLVVVDGFDFSISVFDNKGKFLKKYGQFGSNDGQFMYPSSISYDPQRDWFAVADSGNSRVQIVRIPDSGSLGKGVISRSVAGPLRACIAPFVILLLAFVAWVVSRRVRRKKPADSE